VSCIAWDDGRILILCAVLCCALLCWAVMCLQVQFSYSVKWTQTTMVFDDRLQRYERFPLNPIHLEV
jgi:hypothetical protein